MFAVYERRNSLELKFGQMMPIHLYNYGVTAQLSHRSSRLCDPRVCDRRPPPSVTHQVQGLNGLPASACTVQRVEGGIHVIRGSR